MMDKYGTRSSIVMVAGWRKVDDDFGDCEVWDKDWDNDAIDEVKAFRIADNKRACSGGNF